jgi:ornithine--oxo-acid transaminase
MFRKTFTKLTKKSDAIALISKRSYAAAAISRKTQHYIDKDNKHVAPYYPPVPVVCEKGERIYLWDVDGRKYYDMLAGFASVSQGHCHPKIAEAMYKQSLKLTMCTRSLLSAQLADTSEFLCDYLGFDKFLSANSGVEAGEAAVKLARKWGYTRKGIP